MRIAMGADHAGFDLKEGLKTLVSDLGHAVVDCGTHSTDPVDYPDIAVKVAQAVTTETVDRGILICGSGVGVCVAANKLKGIRAGLCHDAYSARQGVEHDDMNVLVLGARVIGVELAKDLVRSYLSGRFSGEARHLRRLRKVSALEKGYPRKLRQNASEQGARP